MNKGWRFKGNEFKYINDVLSGGFSAGESGTFVQQLESLFSKKHNQKYSIGCNSGTSTLHTALEAFGVGPGDEVIIPSLTVAMCGFVILQCGATPVYADVKKDTFLMDSKDVERKITSKTKAIMPVHMYGLMCNMNEIMDVANKYGLYVLEDSAQCFLAHDDKNRISGTIGHVGSWSFENSKHMTSGDGGILTTDDAILSDHMRKFAWLGYKNITESSSNVRVDKNLFQTPTWTRHIINSYNYRLPELCAAVALAQLENLDIFCELRHKMGKGYEGIIENNNFDILVPQKTPKGYKNSYYTFAAIFNGEKYDIDWHEFREKYMSFGGDGIFGALQLVGNEPSFKYNKIGWGITPVAKELQKKLMLFTTNQANDEEINIQMDCLDKTLKYYKDLIKKV